MACGTAPAGRSPPTNAAASDAVGSTTRLVFQGDGKGKPALSDHVDHDRQAPAEHARRDRPSTSAPWCDRGLRSPCATGPYDCLRRAAREWCVPKPVNDLLQGQHLLQTHTLGTALLALSLGYFRTGRPATSSTVGSTAIIVTAVGRAGDYGTGQIVGGLVLLREP